eukprot:g26832.t1
MGQQNDMALYLLNRMFDKDRRAQEVARLLSSSRPQTLRVPRRPEQTDLDFEHSKQTRLAQAALRQSALCVGRGAFTLGALRPLPTELLPIPALVLSGRFPPQAGVQSLDPSHHDVKLNVWAEFNNGVAAALQVAASSDVSRGWIAHHRPKWSGARGANGKSSGATSGAMEPCRYPENPKEEVIYDPYTHAASQSSRMMILYILAALLLVASLGSWQALGPKELGEDARDMEGHRNHLVAWSAKRPLWQPVFVHDKLRTFESL